MRFVNVGNTILFGPSGKHEQSDEGQGYSLPADIQYVDARWEIPVVLPLRDCLPPELNMLCNLDGVSDLLSLSNIESCQNYDILDAACCSSCRFQIFPKDPSSVEHLLSVLPQPLLARAKNCSNGNHSSLRMQIQDCLLSESEDEN
ncbi:hypothetical protein Ddye_009105 [Dipteronia dyeriana]|uniref:Uncharacterized protein n=1 Tax=Dipteronia dyeriana TaxID=168575 RepID=A0AAE0CMK6_9ROSI|nr:hypothetical protein Ddye_009105 [Dipteronia dyeriana]